MTIRNSQLFYKKTVAQKYLKEADYRDWFKLTNKHFLRLSRL